MLIVASGSISRIAATSMSTMPASNRDRDEQRRPDRSGGLLGWSMIAIMPEDARLARDNVPVAERVNLHRDLNGRRQPEDPERQ